MSKALFLHGISIDYRADRRYKSHLYMSREGPHTYKSSVHKKLFLQWFYFLLRKQLRNREDMIKIESKLIYSKTGHHLKRTKHGATMAIAPVLRS